MSNKKAKNYSVIIMSDATTHSKDFVLSSKLIKKSIISLCFLLLIFGFIIYDYLTMSFNKEEMHHLKKESIKKDKMITDLLSNIGDLNSSLNKMKDYQRKINIAVGLTSPNSLIEVGSGGRGENAGAITSEMETPGANINLSKSADLSSNRISDDIIVKAKNVAKEAKKTEEILKFVEGVIDEQKVRLACMPSVWPTRGILTDAFGWRIHPFTGMREFHKAVDIATQLGNKVAAAANGVVLVAENRNYLGNVVVIDHGFGYQTWYGHLSSFAVKEGDRVKRFQTIGSVGSTGRSNAPHVHYEVHFMGNPQNPMDYVLD